MSNDVITRAIDALASRRDLSSGRDRRGPGPDHGGPGVRAADRRFPGCAAHQGGDGRGAHGPGAHDARAGRSGEHPARAPARHRGHGRRAADVQRLHHGGHHRRGRGLRGRQARQPLGHRPVGIGGPDRGAGRQAGPVSGGRRALHRRGGLRLHVRARPTTRPPASWCRCARSWACARSSTSSGR